MLKWVVNTVHGLLVFVAMNIVIRTPVETIFYYVCLFPMQSWPRILISH